MCFSVPVALALLPEPADTGRWRLGGGGRVVEQSDQRVVTPYALKQHGDALGSLIWDYFFFVQRSIDVLTIAFSLVGFRSCESWYTWGRKPHGTPFGNVE